MTAIKITSSKGLDPPIATSEVDRPLRQAMLVSTGCERVPNLKHGGSETRRSLLSKRLIEILNQIVRMLQADRAS